MRKKAIMDAAKRILGK